MKAVAAVLLFGGVALTILGRISVHEGVVRRPRFRAARAERLLQSGVRVTIVGVVISLAALVLLGLAAR